METKKIIAANKQVVFLHIIFFVGIIGHLYDPLRNLMLLLTPLTLLLTGFIVIFYSYKTSTIKFLYWAVLTYVFTFIIEVIGVKTGFIFGKYIYGPTLGIKLSGVPLIIGFNWMLVILGSISVARLITNNIFLSGFISAFIAFVFDFILEPVAIRLDYWNWTEGIIPIQNYVAWFVIGLISAFGFNYLKVNVKSKISLHYLLVQFIFFVTLLMFYN